MADAHKHAHMDMHRTDIALVIRNALIVVVDCVVIMDSVTNVYLIIVDNHNANGNNYYHHYSCHSLLRHLLSMPLCQQYST